MPSKKILILAAFFYFAAIISAGAQKLPNLQENSLLAPANIKIDGKATEWNDKFQAYNKSIDAFYTMANDDENLYLIIQVTDPYIINKIFSAGITFTINTSGEKTDKDVISITYPVFDGNKRPYIDLRHKPRTTSKEGASNDKPDSVVLANNRHIVVMDKWIKTIGIKELDTLTAVYNREGVKVVGLFNNKMAYTYELSISLKNLGLSITHRAKFAYNIKFNGATMSTLNGYYTGPPNPKTGFPSSVVIDPGAIMLSGDIVLRMIATTDFWGEYTLAKK